MTTGSAGPGAAEPEVSSASPLAHASPEHLRGLQPASTGMRATALVVDAVVVSLINVMCLMPTVIAVQLTSTVTIGVAAAFAFLGAMAVTWFQVIGLWRRGQTLGMRVVGISWLRWSRPGRPGLNAIAKMLVLSIVSGLTLGIGAVIIYLVSEDRSGRTPVERPAPSGGSCTMRVPTATSTTMTGSGVLRIPGTSSRPMTTFSPLSRHAGLRPRRAAQTPRGRPPGPRASSPRSRGDPESRRQQRRPAGDPRT